jgi:hypothetical protein
MEKTIMKSPHNKLTLFGITFLSMTTVLLAVVLCIFVGVSRPVFVDLNISTTKFEQITFEGKPYLRVERETGSPVGQIQEISYAIDPAAKTVKVYSYMVLLNPFSPVDSHRRWPLIIDLSPLPDGEYKVECYDRGHFQEAVRFNKQESPKSLK